MNPAANCGALQHITAYGLVPVMGNLCYGLVLEDRCNLLRTQPATARVNVTSRLQGVALKIKHQTVAAFVHAKMIKDDQR